MLMLIIIETDIGQSANSFIYSIYIWVLCVTKLGWVR